MGPVGGVAAELEEAVGEEVGAVERGEFSESEWTHLAHLRVAWLHLRRYPLDEAHLRMRGLDSRSFVADNAERLARDAPLRHYSRPRLLSIEARARFLEPDQVPLP